VLREVSGERGGVRDGHQSLAERGPILAEGREHGIRIRVDEDELA
jgi:hypothetical protein